MSVGHCLYAYGKSRSFFQMQMYLLKFWLQITEAQMALRQLQEKWEPVLFLLPDEAMGTPCQAESTLREADTLLWAIVITAMIFLVCSRLSMPSGKDMISSSAIVFPEQWRSVPCLFCIDIWGFLCSLIWAGNDFIHLFTIFIVASAVFPQMLFVVCICSVPEWNLQQK